MIPAANLVNLHNANAESEHRLWLRKEGSAVPPCRNHWQRDSEIQSCQECGQPFTLLRRKHHCRRCGGIFCAEDTEYLRRLNFDAVPEVGCLWARVCRLCWEIEFESGPSRDHTNQFSLARSEKLRPKEQAMMAVLAEDSTRSSVFDRGGSKSTDKPQKGSEAETKRNSSRFWKSGSGSGATRSSVTSNTANEIDEAEVAAAAESRLCQDCNLNNSKVACRLCYRNICSSCCCLVSLKEDRNPISTCKKCESNVARRKQMLHDLDIATTAPILSFYGKLAETRKQIEDELPQFKLKVQAVRDTGFFDRITDDEELLSSLFRQFQKKLKEINNISFNTVEERTVVIKIEQGSMELLRTWLVTFRTAQHELKELLDIQIAKTAAQRRAIGEAKMARERMDSRPADEYGDMAPAPEETLEYSTEQVARESRRRIAGGTLMKLASTSDMRRMSTSLEEHPGATMAMAIANAGNNSCGNLSTTPSNLELSSSWNEGMMDGLRRSVTGRGSISVTAATPASAAATPAANNKTRGPPLSPSYARSKADGKQQQQQQQLDMQRRFLTDTVQVGGKRGSISVDSSINCDVRSSNNQQLVNTIIANTPSKSNANVSGNYNTLPSAKDKTVVVDKTNTRSSAPATVIVAEPTTAATAATSNSSNSSNNNNKNSNAVDAAAKFSTVAVTTVRTGGKGGNENSSNTSNNSGSRLISTGGEGSKKKGVGPLKLSSEAHEKLLLGDVEFSDDDVSPRFHGMSKSNVNSQHHSNNGVNHISEKFSSQPISTQYPNQQQQQQQQQKQQQLPAPQQQPPPPQPQPQPQQSSQNLAQRFVSAPQPVRTGVLPGIVPLSTSYEGQAINFPISPCSSLSSDNVEIDDPLPVDDDKRIVAETALLILVGTERLLREFHLCRTHIPQKIFAGSVEKLAITVNIIREEAIAAIHESGGNIDMQITQAAERVELLASQGAALIDVRSGSWSAIIGQISEIIRNEQKKLDANVDAFTLCRSRVGLHQLKTWFDTVLSK